MNKRRISDEIRSAILAASPSISHSELARKHGVSDVSVYTIRKQAGISLAKRHGTAKLPGAKPQKTPSAKPVPAPASSERHGLTANLEAALNAIWIGLPIRKKFDAISGLIQEA